MRVSRSSVLVLSVFMLALTGCGKGAEQPSKTKDVDEPAKPATPEPEVEGKDSATPEPATPEPATPEPKAIIPSAGEGFGVGPAPATNQELEGMVESEGAQSLSNAGATVIPSAHGVLDGENNLSLFLRARVEFEGFEADKGLNHERAATEAPVERVFTGLREVAKLPDGRWVVDVMLTDAFGEDSLGSTTDHSVIVVDPTNKTAKVVWTGADSSMSEMGVCMTESTHAFTVAGEELVVSKTEGTEFDVEMAAEMGMSADDCAVKDKASSEVARVGLAGK